MSTLAFAPANATRLTARRAGVCGGSRAFRASPPVKQNIVTSQNVSRGTSRPLVVSTTARLSGLGGPRVAPESREDNRMVVAKTLLTVREGDLLSLTVTSGDGGGHLASGEDETREIWMTVTKISTSTGGRRQLEGESNGLRVQLIDQGRGLQGARLGVAGAVLDPTKAKWMQSLKGWQPLVSKRFDLERNVLSSVVSVTVVASLEKLEQCLEHDHKPWTTGIVSPTRRAVILDPVEHATQTAGELLALLKGKRSVVLCQLHASWLPSEIQPITDSPWAAQMLKKCVEHDDIGFEISVSDDDEGHAGVSAVLYRTDKQFLDPKDVDPKLAAQTIAKLGAQANCPAVTPYERVLVGIALGYTERDVAYHLRNEGGAFSATYFMRARKALGIDVETPLVVPKTWKPSTSTSAPPVSPKAVPNMEKPEEAIAQEKSGGKKSKGERHAEAA
tara:strand:- start:1572 stop:2912 length:1341 start_codon:yes stop_codon:yes gene_type:complete